MSVRPPHEVLGYAARLPIVAKYLGELFLVVAALSVVPLLWAVCAGDTLIAWRIVQVITAMAAFGVLCARLRVTAPMQANEALLVAALAFLGVSAAMIWPFMVVCESPLDAWFESVSAVTTTGLSVLPRAETVSGSLLFMRAWMQWYGGLGIAVLSVALLAADDASRQRLLGNLGTEGLVATTRRHAQRIAGVYASLTLLAIALIHLAGASWFDAVCHALSGVSTGGFSTRDGSLAAYPGWQVPAAVTAVSFSGAVSLPLYYFAYRGDWRRVRGDEQLRALLLLTALACCGFYLLAFGMRSPDASSIGHAVIMGVSAQSTTGFSSLPVAELGAAAKIGLLFAMACGGSIGSTAGGVKLLRVVIVARLLLLTLRRFAMPRHALIELRIGDRTIPDDLIAAAALTVLLFLLVCMLSWLPFVALGHDPLNALFEVTSATGTVGLSTGVTGPGLAPLLKLILCIDMLCGRLEFFAILILVYPGTWLGQRSGAS